MPEKKTKTAPRGRPKKDDEDRKGTSIRILVTSDQKKALTAAAEKAGLDVSAWLRMLGLKQVSELGLK